MKINESALLMEKFAWFSDYSLGNTNFRDLSEEFEFDFLQSFVSKLYALYADLPKNIVCPSIDDMWN